MPPIPLCEGTRPYQAMVFQWSLHTLEADGALHHRDFLVDGDADPRRAFAETLIEALSGSDTPIIVYSHYERTRLRELAGELPDLRDALAQIVGRLVLLPIVRNAVYFRLQGSAIRSNQSDPPCVPNLLTTISQISPMARRLPPHFSVWHQTASRIRWE